MERLILICWRMIPQDADFYPVELLWTLEILDWVGCHRGQMIGKFQLGDQLRLEAFNGYFQALRTDGTNGQLRSGRLLPPRTNIDC